MKTAVAIIVVIIILAAGAFLIFGEKPPADIERANIDKSINEAGEKVAVDNQIDNSVMISQTVDVTSEYSVEDLSFSFEGYGPGKSHVGTFDKIEITKVWKEVPSEKIVQGEIKFYTNSLNIEPAILNQHLCAGNFFDCENYTEVTFNLKTVTEQSNTSYTATGDLTFKETTKSISFPIEISKDGVASADFLLDVSEFGFKAPGVVNKEVRIKFNGRI